MPWNIGKDRRGSAAPPPPPPDPPGDEEVLKAVRALQAGAGRDAFAPIYRRYRRSLFAFFSRQSTLREEAEDLAQQTLFRAYENIHQYRFEARFQTWLRQIGENVWRNAVRERQAAKRDARLEPLDPTGQDEEAASVVDAAPTPEQTVLAEERRRVLRAAIDSLPPGMRLCTRLRLFADLKYREISAVTGISLDTVRSQLFEARQRLKLVLDEYFQGVDF